MPMPELDKPARDGRFWLSPEERGDGIPRFTLIDSFVDSVRTWHQVRHERYFEYLKLYGISYDEFGRGSTDPNDDTLKFNICEPIVDTAVNKICKSRIVPMALTTGGTFKERQRAKNFNRFISGLFMECGVFDKDYTWTTDIFVGDCAIAKVVEKDERVVVERCDPTRIWWDPEEAHLTHGVTVVVEDHFIDRFQLLALVDEWDAEGKLICSLDEAKELILAIQSDQQQSGYFRKQNQHDVIMLREAWHAKSTRKSDDGGHVISLPGKIDLVAEPYEYTKIPHIFMSRKMPMFGLTSPGLMAGIAAGQKEHDRVTERIRIGQDCAPPRLIIRKGTVNPAQLDDIPGTILEAEDPSTDVQQFNAQPVHPDIYSYRKDIVSDMQLTASVPEMSMNGRPPDGVTAAKALATLDDTVAEKLSQPLRCRERFHVAIGDRCLEMVSTIAKRHRGKYVVYADNGKMLEKMNWKDVSIPLGSYRLKCFPTNFLSQTPSVRYERLSEMHSNGEISELEFRSLSEIPDLESDNDLETAPQDIVDMCIDAILSDGKQFVCEAFDDHALVVQRGMKAYNMSRVQAPSPEEDPGEYKTHATRIKALANYINSAMNWLKPPAPAPNAAAPGTPPPAQPGMPAPPGMADQGPMGMMPPQMGPPLQGPPGGPSGPNPFGPPMGELVSNGMV